MKDISKFEELIYRVSCFNKVLHQLLKMGLQLKLKIIKMQNTLPIKYLNFI